jgi:hypothetical protein
MEGKGRKADPLKPERVLLGWLRLTISESITEAA